MNHQERIEEMMRRAGQAVPGKPTVPDEKTRLLRARLIMEEALETIQKGLGVQVYGWDWDPIEFDDMDFECVGPVNMEEIADGCADVSVVTIGTLSACGIKAEPLLEVVDENNLAKFSGDGHRDEHGKWIKPTGRQPPDIGKILADQGWDPGA